MQTAYTILEQLGGRRFISMTGASNLAGDDKSLQFKIMKNAKKVTHVSIELENDFYNVVFYNVRGLETKKMNELTGLYAEDLRKAFEQNTGLYTSL